MSEIFIGDEAHVASLSEMMTLEGANVAARTLAVPERQKAALAYLHEHIIPHQLSKPKAKVIGSEDQSSEPQSN